MNFSNTVDGRSISRICRLIVPVSLIAITASSCQTNQTSPTDRLMIDGRIEADETRLSVLTPGKVSSVDTEEGATVQAGQKLLELDSGLFNDQLKSLDELIEKAQIEKREISQLASKLRKQPTKAFSKLDMTALEFSDPQPGKPSLLKTDGETSPPTLVVKTTPDKELTEPLKQINEVQRNQTQLLNEATANMLATVDGAYNRELQMLKEGKEEALNSAGTKFPFSSLTKAKRSEIEQVFDAKVKALTQAYQAQRKAISDSAAAKKQALDESINSRRDSLRQLSTAKDEMRSELTSAQTNIQQAIEKEKKLLSSAMQVESKRIARATLDQVQSASARSKAAMIEMQKEQVQARIAMLDTEILKAQALRTELKNKIDLCTLRSPIKGICVMLAVQPGELVIPGQTLLKLIDGEKLYVHATVPEGDLSRLKVGQRAEVEFESARAKPLAARVTTIDSTPCFTPKGVYFKEDRIKQAYGLKLSVEENSSSAKPGMPVSVTIFADDKGE